MTELLDLARRLAGAARDGEQVEAYVAHTRDTEVKVYGGDVESISSAEVDGVGVRVVHNNRQGYAWAGSLDADVLDDTLAEARDNAAFATHDEYLGLVRPEDFAGIALTELDLWRDAMLVASADEKVQLTLELERLTMASNPQIRGIEAAQYGDGVVEVAIASSTGVEATARRTVCSCYVFAMAGGGAQTQTGYGFSVGRSIEELDPQRAADEAAQRAVRLLGARQAKSRRLPVVFDPLVTASFLGLISAALNGESVLKGRSMFAERAGESVASPLVTLVDDPTIPDAYGASTHDAEGVPTRRTELIHNGVLQRFLHNTYTGRRSGAGTTGSAVRGFKSTPSVGARALHLVPGQQTREELLGALPDALYVQSVSGLHSGANPISGDFSVGAEGLMLEGGAFGEPVREVTIASTLQRMLLDVTAIGSDLTWLPGGAAGLTLVVGDMMMSGL